MRGQRIGRAIKPLFEREEPLEVLRAAYEGARNGSGHLVFVAGEARVGKTTLVRQFARMLPEKAVVLGSCDPLDTPRPLGPLLDMVDEVRSRGDIVAVQGGVHIPLHIR